MHTCPCHSDILTEAREEQKYRKGSKGVSALGLASGKKISQEAELEVKIQPSFPPLSAIRRRLALIHTCAPAVRGI